MGLKDKLVELLGEDNELVDTIAKEVGENFVPLDKLNKVKKDYKATSETLDGLKKELDDLKSAALSEEDKLAKKQAEYDKAVNDYTLKVNSLEVEKRLAGLNLDKGVYEKILPSLVTSNLDDSLAVTDALIELVGSVSERVGEDTRNKILDGSLQPTSVVTEPEVNQKDEKNVKLNDVF